LILKDSDIAADLTVRFGINCSPTVVKKVHEAFNMTTEGGDIEAFSNFVLQFYLKHFDHEEKSLDEYPELKTRVDWDFAVLAELAKFKEIEGTFFQCG
jgi:hypothetical protein